VKKVWFLIIALLIGLTIVAVVARNNKSFSPQIRRQLERIVDDTIKKYNTPGAIVGVWQGNRKAWIYAKGISNIETKRKIEPDDRFRIASNTKTFIAVVVLQLVDEKKLKLEDRLDKFVPKIPHSDKITIRQLLNHTSGIYDFISDEDFQKVYWNNPLKKWTPQEEIDIILAHKPDFKPGEKWNYSNSNYTLLGIIIEKVTGAKVETEVQERIIKPLGLSNTSFPVSPAMPGKYTHGYIDDENGVLKDITLVDPSCAWTSGAIISNLYDLKRWVEAAARGELLSDAMKREHLRWVPTGIEGFEYGLGILNVHGFIGHNGKILGYKSFILHSPEKDITIVILLNKCNEDEKSQPMSEIIKVIQKIVN